MNLFVCFCCVVLFQLVLFDCSALVFVVPLFVFCRLLFVSAACSCLPSGCCVVSAAVSIGGVLLRVFLFGCLFVSVACSVGFFFFLAPVLFFSRLCYCLCAAGSVWCLLAWLFCGVGCVCLVSAVVLFLLLSLRLLFCFGYCFLSAGVVVSAVFVRLFVVSPLVIFRLFFRSAAFSFGCCCLVCFLFGLAAVLVVVYCRLVLRFSCCCLSAFVIGAVFISAVFCFGCVCCPPAVHVRVGCVSFCVGRVLFSLFGLAALLLVSSMCVCDLCFVSCVLSFSRSAGVFLLVMCCAGCVSFSFLISLFCFFLSAPFSAGGFVFRFFIVVLLWFGSAAILF